MLVITPRQAGHNARRWSGIIGVGVVILHRADDDTVADSSERHGGELREDAAAGRSDQDSTVAVDSSEAETPTATRLMGAITLEISDIVSLFCI